MTTAGSRIATASRKARLNYRQVADGAGVEYSWLRSVATDKIKKPDARELRKVATFLGLDYREMLALTDQLGEAEPVTASAAPDDLLAVVRQQTAHIDALTGAIERQSQDIAALLALIDRLMPRPSTPAGQAPPSTVEEALETAADHVSAELAQRDLEPGEGPVLRAVPAAAPSPRTPRADRPR